MRAAYEYELPTNTIVWLHWVLESVGFCLKRTDSLERRVKASPIATRRSTSFRESLGCSCVQHSGRAMQPSSKVLRVLRKYWIEDRGVL